MALVRRVVGISLLAVFVVVGLAAFRVWYVAREDHRDRVDAIVVLGASQFDGRPSSIFRARLNHAAALRKANVAPRIITVGGSRPNDRFTEAAAGKRYLEQQGVPADQILAVGQGSDTLESMTAVSAVMRPHGWRSAVLVTDPWHELRSRQMATDAGIKATTSPARSGPAVQTRGTEFRYVARETAAYLYYRLFHRSAEHGTRAV